MPDELWLGDLPAALRRPLVACARGDIPANIAAMQLLMEARQAGEAESALTQALLRLDQPAHALAAKRLRQALEVMRANPQAWRTVKSVLGDVSHDGAAPSPEKQLRYFANAFDRAAQNAPEGSVALYALGNPDLLNAATAEVVARMRDWGLLARENSVLDLGCGIGRFGGALAGEVKSVVGVDISGGMIEAARRRCAGLRNVSFRQTCGRDLSLFEEERFDLVLAVDTFPYLVQSGMSLVEGHFAEAARVLKPRGELLILNFSYRGHREQDRADIRRLAHTFGFEVLLDGASPFTLWDGLAFHLSKA